MQRRTKQTFGSQLMGNISIGADLVTHLGERRLFS
jgi:hypothetical protein